MKPTTSLTAIILAGFLLCLPAFAAEPQNAGQYKITQLPISDFETYNCDAECEANYTFYEFEQLAPQLQKALAEQNKQNAFGLDGDGDTGYYFLPPKGDIQVMLATRDIVVNSGRLVTMKNNQLIDQMLISFGGPDDELVIQFELDKNYQLTLKRGISDTDHEKPVVWHELWVYQLGDDGKLSEVKKTLIK